MPAQPAIPRQRRPFGRYRGDSSAANTGLRGTAHRLKLGPESLEQGCHDPEPRSLSREDLRSLGSLILHLVVDGWDGAELLKPMKEASDEEDERCALLADVYLDEGTAVRLFGAGRVESAMLEGAADIKRVGTRPTAEAAPEGMQGWFRLGRLQERSWRDPTPHLCERPGRCGALVRSLWFFAKTTPSVLWSPFRGGLPMDARLLPATYVGVLLDGRRLFAA